MSFLVTPLNILFSVTDSERRRALDRIARSEPTQEDGFPFYALPVSREEERHLLRRPEALQFHYQGNLYKVTGERASGVFELFLDLLYVAILALFSADVSRNPDWIHILKYIIIFFHVYQIWQDIREIFDNYYTDDVLQRALVLVVMAGTAIFANNVAHVNAGVKDPLEESAFHTAVYAYQTVHGILILNWFFYSLFIPEHLVRMRLMGCVNVISFAIRSGLFFVGHWDSRITLAIIALLIERLFWIYIYSPLFKSHDESEFSTAVNIEHESDRMTALYIIVLGEFFNGVVVQSPKAIGLHEATGRVVLVLVIAFCLNWLYVHNDGSVRNTHAIRRSATSAMTWFVIHEPLSAALVLSGDIAAEFVKFDVLESHNLQWIFCYGLAVGIFSLWVLAQCTLGRDELTWPKQVRLFMRVIDFLIFISLPLTTFDTTSTLIVCSVFLGLTVIWENYGSLPRRGRELDQLPRVPDHSRRLPAVVQNLGQEVESLIHTNETTEPDNYGSLRE